MEFEYSIELPAAENSTGGLAGNIPVRRHCDPLLEDFGALRAQEDWARLVGPLQGFKGGLSSKYGLMQVAVPECRPERLGVIAYASEVGFLYDDCTEFFSGEEVGKANDDMQSAFTEGVQQGKIDGRNGGLKAIQATLFEAMMALDKPRALTAMNVWIEFLSEAAGRQHAAEYNNFDEYMRYRVLDVGEMFWFGLVTFGMALTIPESELCVIRAMSRPCWIVLALQNDICSYAKEMEAARKTGASHVVNALTVLMKEHKIDMEAAEAICRRHVESNIIEYQLNVAKSKSSDGLSRDAKIYLESLLYTISGDAAWSLITPRYNASQHYNKLQISMMKNGVDAFTEGMLQERSFLTRSLLWKRWGELDTDTKMPSSKTIAYGKLAKANL